MARSKIEQTDISQGFPLTPLTAPQAAAMENNSVFLDQDENLVTKKDGTDVTIIAADGSLPQAGVFMFQDANTTPTNTARVQKLRFTGDALTSFTYNEPEQEVEIQFTSGTGGGGGGSPSGPAGGDLSGTYPNPSLGILAPSPAGSYSMANVVVDAKGRVTGATAGATITSATDGQVLRYKGSAFVNASEPYEAALYEAFRAQGGWDSVIANKLLSAAGLTLAGSATYDTPGEFITFGSGGTMTTSSDAVVGQFIKIVTDVPAGADFTIQYSVNGGSGWSTYTKGATVDLTAGTSQFRLRITCNSGSFNLSSYGIFHSPALPKGTSASSVAIETSGFSGNLTSTDNTVQKVAAKVDQLATGGGYAIEAVSGLGWSGKSLEKGKEYLLLDTDLASAYAQQTTATLPALSSLAVGEGLIVNACTLSRGSNWSDGDIARVQRAGSDTIRYIEQKPFTALTTGENANVTTGNTTVSAYYYYNGDYENFRRILFVKATTTTWTAVDLSYLRNNL